MRDETLRPVREALGLGAASRVVVINSEGATDPELYRRVVSGTDPSHERTLSVPTRPSAVL
jgi:threonine dehydratase